MSFTDTNHFRISLSFSYWNITGVSEKIFNGTLAHMRPFSAIKVTGRVVKTLKSYFYYPKSVGHKLKIQRLCT